jgi:HrpA-like RNA helicase
VIRSATNGDVTIVAAPTGSAKTMLIPALLSDAYTHEPNGQKTVIVLEPRRALAVNAATNMAHLTETQLGHEVGYAVGKMSGDKSLFSTDPANPTKVLFMTYGYAFASGWLDKADTVVLDEVHEHTAEMSVARAKLYTRKQLNPSLRIVEMSGTIRAERQAAFWQPTPTAIHTAEEEKDKMPCEVREEFLSESGRTMEDIIIELLQGPQIKHTVYRNDVDPALAASLMGTNEMGQPDQARKGIAGFVEGVKEVERTVDQLRERLVRCGMGDVEVVGLHGSTPPDQRAHALAQPRQTGVDAHGKPVYARKVIIGTDAMESGVTMPWVDAGVSNGIGKQPHYREDTGAQALVAAPKAQDQLEQQKGRINRSPETTGFKKGLFIVCSEKKVKRREPAISAELQRVSMTPWAFRMAAMKVNPQLARWDSPVSEARFNKAKEELMRLGLVNDDWSLTADGKYVAGLPVSPEAGAMLCEARRLDPNKDSKLLADTMILAVIHDREKEFKIDSTKAHGADATSTLLDSFKAYRNILNDFNPTLANVTQTWLDKASDEDIEALHSYRERLSAACHQYNIRPAEFANVARVVDEIRARQGLKIIHRKEPRTPDHYDLLKQTILSGSVNQMFANVDGRGSDLLRHSSNRRSHRGERFNGYEMSDRCKVKLTINGMETSVMAGHLWELPPRGDRDTAPPIQLTRVTSVDSNTFLAWLNRHPEALTDLSTDATKRQQATVVTGNYYGLGELSLPLEHARAGAHEVVHRLMHPDEEPLTHGDSHNDDDYEHDRWQDSTRARRGSNKWAMGK